MEIGYKIWIDEKGKVFGEGPYRLLKLIAKEGSIHKAALSMGLSYKKAWLILKNLEEKMGFPFLEKRIGGESGGGSSLTEEAKRFLSTYEAFKEEADRTLKEIFRRHFSSFFK